MTTEPPAAHEPLVLIVDDNEKNLKLARDVLGAAGLRTLEAANGAEAIALAAARRPDVILMDMRLPDMDGADATRRLADGERTASIPVVAMSSVPLERGRDWFRTAGFAGWLEKPIDVSALPGEVRRYAGC